MTRRRGELLPQGRLDLRLVIAAIFALFLLSAVLGAVRKDVTQGFDELAHLSYVADLQAHPQGVRLEQLKMLDPATFRFTATGNYINHAAPYYRLMATLGPPIEGRPGAALWHRLINVAIVALGLALTLTAVLPLARSTEEQVILTLAIGTIPVLAPLAGSVNNDNLAFLAGGMLMLGSARFLSDRRSSDLAIAAAAVVMASAAKLTALMLCGGFFVLLLALAARSERVRPAHLAIAAAGLMIAALIPIDLWLSYGSPAPDTPAQHALLIDGARSTGWASQPRLGVGAYLARFVADFVAGWRPLLDERSALQSAMLLIPALTIAIAVAGSALAIRTVARREDTGPIEPIVAAGAAAILATLAVHIGFSYQRHLATGWMMDTYPRYYLPLIAVVPLAALIVLRRLPSGKPALAAFLLASPILFGLLG